MPKYANLGGDSNIDSYEISSDSITVVFSDNSAYLYNHLKPGTIHVDQMKLLAEQGEGLNSYINRKVRKNYALKIR